MYRERDIEKYMTGRIERLGGVAFKFVSPGNDGVPDRLVLLPGGRILFIELKTKGGRVKPIQAWQQERLRRRGAEVHTVWSKAQVDELLGGGDAT